MEIYVLRHGIAEPRRSGFPDEKRALTEDGVEKLRKVLACARAANAAPSLVLTSPYRRAVQTAEIAAEVLGCRQRIVQTDALAPSSSPEAVWEEIRARHREKALLLSGHEPLLGQATSYLLGAAWVLLDLKKGALACVNLDQWNEKPCGLLQWLLTPRLAAARAK